MNRYITSCFLLLAAMSANATDRVVSVNGTYNTISSAIAASSDGDRILVEPGTYNENLQLDKSISLLPNQEGGRYTVTGTYVRLVPGSTPRTISITGMRKTTGSLQTYAGGGGSRLHVQLLDCFVLSADFGTVASQYIELYRDTLGQKLTLMNGRVVGCTFGGGTYSGSLLQVNGGSAEPDHLEIIGNQFLPTNNGASTPYIIDVTVDKEFHIENNFIGNNTTTANFLRIQGAPPIGTPTCTVNSNTFYRSASSANTVIYSLMSIVTVDLVNNVSIGNTGTFIDWQFRSGKTSANLLAAPSWINTTTGQPSLGSPLIDAGDPDPRYLDLDLTTNDAGCYGGSNSRENFTTPVGSAVVGFMQAPRVVAQGEPVNISATGFDR